MESAALLEAYFPSSGYIQTDIRWSSLIRTYLTYLAQQTAEQQADESRMVPSGPPIAQGTPATAREPREAERSDSMHHSIRW